MPHCYAPTKSSIVCLVALSIGPLTREGSLYRFGRRSFSARVVNELIRLGLAKRDGEILIRAKADMNAVTP